MHSLKTIKHIQFSELLKETDCVFNIASFCCQYKTLSDEPGRQQTSTIISNHRESIALQCMVIKQSDAYFVWTGVENKKWARITASLFDLWKLLHDYFMFYESDNTAPISPMGNHCQACMQVGGGGGCNDTTWLCNLFKNHAVYTSNFGLKIRIFLSFPPPCIIYVKYAPTFCKVNIWA